MRKRTNRLECVCALIALRRVASWDNLELTTGNYAGDALGLPFQNKARTYIVRRNTTFATKSEIASSA
jgi:hypothetical protein